MHDRGRLVVAMVLAALLLGSVVGVLVLSPGSREPSPPVDGPAEPALKGALADPLRYVAIGDSLALGFAAPVSYPVLVADDLASDTDRQVELHVHARVRWTSADVLESVRRDEALRARIQAADVVTWNAGGNDLLRLLPRLRSGTCGTDAECLTHAADSLEANLQALAGELEALVDDEAILATMDLFDPGPHLDVDGSTGDIRRALTATNTAIARLAARVAPVADAFARASGGASPQDVGLIGSDGVHPTAAGQRLLARGLVDVLRAATRPSPGDPLG